jgi:hypothetical protein
MPHSTATDPGGMYTNITKLGKRILISLAILLLASGAHAGKPILDTVIESDHIYAWEMQRINASEWTETESDGATVLGRHRVCAINRSAQTRDVDFNIRLINRACVRSIGPVTAGLSSQEPGPRKKMQMPVHQGRSLHRRGYFA